MSATDWRTYAPPPLPSLAQERLFETSAGARGGGGGCQEGGR